MDATLKAQWLTALRSGEYSQGSGVLRGESTDGHQYYCCLGVLCDVIDPDGWSENGRWTDSVAPVDESGRTHSNKYLLPETLAERLFGFDPDGNPNQSGAFMDEHDGLECLSALNDQGCTFDEVADVIEEKF